jgi:hypothetical protein
MSEGRALLLLVVVAAITGILAGAWLFAQLTTGAVPA